MHEIKELGGVRCLVRDGAIVVPDSDLWRDWLKWWTDGICGHILLTGLGLGVLAKRLAEDPKVESITVLEQEAEVILLCGFSHPKVRIIEADAWYWKADQTFDFAFHDIWADYKGKQAEAHRLMRCFASCSSVQRALPLDYEDFLRSHVPVR